MYSNVGTVQCRDLQLVNWSGFVINIGQLPTAEITLITVMNHISIVYIFDSTEIKLRNILRKKKKQIDEERPYLLIARTKSELKMGNELFVADFSLFSKNIWLVVSQC